MRGLRSYGLLALFIGAQVVALALAFPFKTAGLEREREEIGRAHV